MSASPSALALASLGALVALIVVVVVLLARMRNRSGGEPAAPPLYLDEGRDSHTFASTRYRIRARPDKLEGDADEATLVELKSRARGFHASDRAQIIATALAVRAGGIHVTRARLETLEGAPVTLELALPDEALFERIRPAVDAARLTLGGTAPAATPSRGKCRACGYRARCPYRADDAPPPLS